MLYGCFESFYVKLLYFQEQLDPNYEHDSALEGKTKCIYQIFSFHNYVILGKIAIDYCMIFLIFYLGMRSAHSVYHLDADEDEDEWSE